MLRRNCPDLGDWWRRLVGCRRLPADEQGQSAVLLALVMVALIGFTGLALDAGHYYNEQNRLQNVADAAALAGASALPYNQAGAAARAQDLIRANGLDPAAFTITTNYNNRPDQIQVKASRLTETYFVRVLGIREVPVVAGAAARSGPPRPFDYALFSGSETQTLRLNGNNTVSGGTHGNTDIRLIGNNQMGDVEAVGTTTLTGNNHTGQVTDHVPVIPLPDLNTQGLSQGATRVYNGDQTFSGNLGISGIVVVHGNVHLSGNLRFNGILLVDGDVTITGNTTHVFSGQAAIVAMGDITILGNTRLVYDTPRASGGTSALALASTGGNITIGGNAEIHGIVYAPSTAPGTGDITLHGNAEIEGAVIGNTVSASGNLEIGYDRDALSAVPPTVESRGHLVE
ncbi:MAG: pilus assembly protein TadG-related protein [Bacillota bacterium]